MWTLKNKTKFIDTEKRGGLEGSRLEEVQKKGEGNQEVQTPSYEINKS